MKAGSRVKLTNGDPEDNLNVRVGETGEVVELTMTYVLVALGGRMMYCGYDQIEEVREYDEGNPHCRECKCADCRYFYTNEGNCRDSCEECDGESHTGDCPMYEEVC